MITIGSRIYGKKKHPRGLEDGSQYVVKEEIGHGGQGTVFLVVGDSKKKEYALKVLNNPREKAIERFKRDFQAVKKLSDPRIIKYVEFVEKDSKNAQHCIIMEYIEGTDLEKESVKGAYRDDLLKGLLLFKTIVDTMNIAHKNQPQIIHRDLKPANILLRKDGTPVISDFGICAIIDGEFSSLTSTNEDVGARHFIAPELEGSHQTEPSCASDIYSLGKVLYFMLSGGVILTRENYAQPQYDLRKIEGASAQLNYIYERIFPKTICELNNRFKSIDDLSNELDNIVELINEHFYPVGIGRKCIICGEGKYQPPRLGHQTHRPGAYQFYCDKCGNAQFFERTDSNIVTFEGSD